MKKKIFSSLIALATAFAMVLGTPIVSYAAPQTMADGGIFDAEYYAAKNPDVVAVMGTDAATLYAHYLLFGKTEGRLPYDGSAVATAPVAVLSPIDIYNYLASSAGYVWMNDEFKGKYFTAYSFDANGGYVEITHSSILGDIATVGGYSVATGNYLPSKINYKVGAIDKNAVYLYMVSRVTTDGKTTAKSNKTTAYKIVGFDGTNLVLEVKTLNGAENRTFTKMLFS